MVIVFVRRTFLCQANEGQEVYHHDGPISDKVWQCAQWFSCATLSAGRCIVGLLHTARIR